MSNDLYVLYDSSVENEESLDKFNVILKHAGFSESKIKHISLEDYIIYLEANEFKFHPCMVCINQTYKKINMIYSEKLEVPIFDFFSKEYVNKEANIILYGILFSVSSIYEPAYKKFAWSVVQKLYADYKQLNPTTVSDLAQAEYLVENTAVEETPPHQDVVQTETLVPEPVTQLVTEVPSLSSDKEAPSYEELLAFYENTKTLIAQFNLIQQQTKLLESHLNASN